MKNIQFVPIQYQHHIFQALLCIDTLFMLKKGQHNMPKYKPINKSNQTNTEQCCSNGLTFDMESKFSM